jgi:hypothetical protein
MERDFFIDSLLVRVRYMTVTIVAGRLCAAGQFRIPFLPMQEHVCEGLRGLNQQLHQKVKLLVNKVLFSAN